MGDAVCWMDRVCPECSAMLEHLELHGVVTCWRCSARIRLADEGPVVVPESDELQEFPEV